VSKLGQQDVKQLGLLLQNCHQGFVRRFGSRAPADAASGEGVDLLWHHPPRDPRPPPSP
jgi:hypothetical protein